MIQEEFNECVNIISKTEITETPEWIVVVVIVFLMMLTCGLNAFICFNIKDVKKTVSLMEYIVIGSLIAGVTGMLLVYNLFERQTGRYEYQATIEKNKMTVCQYESFLDEYNPEIRDGIYYWRD